MSNHFSNNRIMRTLFCYKIFKKYPTKMSKQIDAALYGEAVNIVIVWLVLAVGPVKRVMKKQLTEWT